MAVGQATGDTSAIIAGLSDDHSLSQSSAPLYLLASIWPRTCAMAAAITSF
jgi:hypothetical protein